MNGSAGEILPTLIFWASLVCLLVIIFRDWPI